MTGPFPVLDHLDRRPATDRPQCIGEDIQIRPRQRHPVGGGQHQQRVARAHLPVDADPVEAVPAGTFGRRAQVVLGDRRVGHDVREHRRYRRADHPRALGGDPDTDHATAERQRKGTPFRKASVVQIASLKADPPSVATRAQASGIADGIRSMSRRSPMTPVLGRRPRRAEPEGGRGQLAHPAASSNPGSPVAALATPELTTTAR